MEQCTKVSNNPAFPISIQIPPIEKINGQCYSFERGWLKNTTSVICIIQILLFFFLPSFYPCCTSGSCTTQSTAHTYIQVGLGWGDSLGRHLQVIGLHTRTRPSVFAEPTNTSVHTGFNRCLQAFRLCTFSNMPVVVASWRKYFDYC